jgi:NAD(P)-dependent dehydrogenase (short-subunit alcohol dehydrogenase family)
MANEWAPLRIRVNAVAPGTIRTAGLEQYNQQQLQAAVNNLLIPRMG